MMENILIPVECVMLLTPDGFYERWQYWTQHTKTYKEAYHKTEEETYKYFKCFKYSEYATFKKVVSVRKNKKS